MAELLENGNRKTPRAVARNIVLKTLGVGRVAGYCGVREMAVYQWLQRGTDEKPVPPERVPAIVVGARADGFEIAATDLWPAAAELIAEAGR